MREVERQVMLRIIDQRWREHLEEMDYLKEGINLRAMGQKDPLTEWQREGYEMFGAMMKAIAQDFVRYVMHVQVVQKDTPTLDAPRCSTCRPRPATMRQTRRASTGRAHGGGRGRPPAVSGSGAGADQQAHDRREGRLREDPAQRAVPVRLGQEVQAVPRRRLNGEWMRDFTDDLRDVRRRLDEASEYLKIADSREPAGRAGAEISAPTCGTTPIAPSR